MRKKIIYITDEQSSTVGLTQSNFVWDAPAPRGCARSPAWHRTARAPGRAAGRRCPGPAWCWSASRPALPTGSRCSARSAAAAFLGAKVIKPFLSAPAECLSVPALSELSFIFFLSRRQHQKPINPLFPALSFYYRPLFQSRRKCLFLMHSIFKKE